MKNPLPKFDAPPVVETVLSAQFARLERFSNAHAGWFWKNYLAKDWSRVNSAPRLEDQFERFGEEIRWGTPPGLRILPGSGPERLQILRDDSERMIQVQDSRFIYNWTKQEEQYPSYEQVLRGFEKEFTAFEKFSKDAGLALLDLNQWEVTYVNHIEKGPLWQTLNDWTKIFPQFSFPTQGLLECMPEDFHGEWTEIIGDKRGRLYVSFNRGRVATEKGSEIIRVQLTARGSIRSEAGFHLRDGFDLGHETIVRYFTAMTSSMAHQTWKRSV